MATIPPDIDSDLWLPSFDDQWRCPSCSFDNSMANYPRCKMCEDMHPLFIEDRPITDQSKSIWSCPRCTLNNSIKDAQCKVCGTRKVASNETNVDDSITAPLKSMSVSVRGRRHKDESDAEDIFQQIIKYCRQHKTHFSDDQFIPDRRSIGSGSFGNVSQWLRISNTRPLHDDDSKLPWTIFSSPQPSDIQQGALGNCWLVAVLALISERPRLLEHIFLTKEVNREGAYLLRICHNGLWKKIIVDDYFPCTKHKHLVFTQAKRCQMYVPLIEKACAKLFGSYASLTSGNLREGLQLLTGAPSDYIDLQPSNGALDGNIVWAKLITACESKLLIGVSSGGTGVSSEEYARVHIHGNHAFSILAAHELNNSTSRYVLVRDPHSQSRYTEESVTENVLKQLRLINPAHRSTGAFWISWPRFLRYFSSITISTYNSDHFDIREQGQFTRSSTDYVISYRFHVPTTSLINISLLYHRHYRKTRTYHTQSFVLCDANDLSSAGAVGKHESILMCTRGGFTYWTGSLRAGTYVLIPFSTSFWGSEKKNRNFTIVIHSSVQLNLSRKSKPSTFLADCLISAVTKNCNKKKEKKNAAFYTTSSKSGSKLFIAENQSITKHLILDIDVKVAKNVRHSRSLLFPCNTHDCIPPRHRQIIFITEWIDKHGESAHFKYSYSSKHDNQRTDSTPPIDTSQYDLHLPRPF